eukprot:g19054.t1
MSNPLLENAGIEAANTGSVNAARNVCARSAPTNPNTVRPNVLFRGKHVKVGDGTNANDGCRNANGRNGGAQRNGGKNRQNSKGKASAHLAADIEAVEEAQEPMDDQDDWDAQVQLAMADDSSEETDESEGDSEEADTVDGESGEHRQLDNTTSSDGLLRLEPPFAHCYLNLQR